MGDERLRRLREAFAPVIEAKFREWAEAAGVPVESVKVEWERSCLEGMEQAVQAAGGLTFSIAKEWAARYQAGPPDPDANRTLVGDMTCTKCGQPATAGCLCWGRRLGEAGPGHADHRGGPAEMSEIPGDVWACAQTIWFMRDSYSHSGTAAYLLRAPTHEKAAAQAKRIADHDCRRSGGYRWAVYVNKQPGEQSIGTVNDDPLFLPDPAPDVTAEAKP